jgi:aminoglycoside phosphotransferase (APT) family kinase protein
MELMHEANARIQLRVACQPLLEAGHADQDQALERDPFVAAREWKVLTLLRGSAVPSPRPLWIDAQGRMFCRPAIVTTYLMGKPPGQPRDINRFVQQLADALVAIHGQKLSANASRSTAEVNATLPQPNQHAPSQKLTHPAAAQIWDVLSRRRLRFDVSGTVLLHGDFWPGNTVWTRGRLTGVVDWEGALIGQRGQDVAYCHMDLALSFDRTLADQFVSAYERAAGQSVDDLAWWDLLACWRALPDVSAWLPAWQALVGPIELTASTVRARLNAFIADSLARVPREPIVE